MESFSRKFSLHSTIQQQQSATRDLSFKKGAFKSYAFFLENMTIFYQGYPSVATDLGQTPPYWLNAQLLIDILAVIHPMAENTLPKKRSGFSYEVYVLFQACVELSQTAPKTVAEWINRSCTESKISFHTYKKETFTNGKKRRYFPDQPSLSRALHELVELNYVEKFWNLTLFAHVLILRNRGIIGSDITLLVDYTTERCKKDTSDPYCFGTKEGKTVHKTLSFAILSNDLHQIIANYKIKKRQPKPPLFEEVLERLQSHGFTIKYALVDREFYRKQLFVLFQQTHITVIMPGRNCSLTRQKLENYLQGKGTRYCKGFIKLSYKKGVGFPSVNFDLLLVAKRKNNLTEVKRAFNRGTLTLTQACKRIFPLIVYLGNGRGITTLRGNETYIRYLYRRRWEIEIAFREMNRLGIITHIQNRDIRLAIMGVKSLLYNMWQVQRHLIHKEDPAGDSLELTEFLGKVPRRRYAQYLKVSA